MCTYIFGLVAMIHPNPCWFWKQPSVVMGAVSSLVVHPRVPVGVLRLCGEELLVCCVIHPTVVVLFWSLVLLLLLFLFGRTSVSSCCIVIDSVPDSCASTRLLSYMRVPTLLVVVVE